jgi:hypothetical protein
MEFSFSLLNSSCSDKFVLIAIAFSESVARLFTGQAKVLVSHISAKAKEPGRYFILKD